MGTKKFGPFLSAVAVSFCLGFGAVGCVATGFQLDVASMVTVAAVCLLLALLTGFLSKENVGFFLLLGLCAMTALGLLMYDVQPLRKLLSSITRIYNLGYGWEHLYPSVMESPVTVDTALCLVAGVTILLSGWAVRRGKSAIWALAPALLTVSTCIIVTDTVPQEGHLFLVLMGILLLLLPQSVRRRNREAGARLTALLLVPCLLLSGILFWMVPRAGYEQKGNPVQQAVLEWLQSLPFAPKRGGGMVTGVTVNLMQTGPVEEQTYKIMEVTGARDGVLYLRGQAYDVYTGTQWKVAVINAVDKGWPRVDGGRVGTVKIRTQSVIGIRYFPYYVNRTTMWDELGNGKLSNPYGQMVYSFTQMDPVPGEAQNITLADEIRLQCLALPEGTRAAVEGLVKVITRGQKMSVEQLAELLGDYVRSCASYDRKTLQVPADAEDFALWFLENSQTGYCVHFATAATVLLRSAGIPARYVTGYAVPARKGKTTNVTGEYAHAWVEYFAPGVGWKVLEATPAEGLPQMPEDTPPPTTEPIPTETTEPTEPTQVTTVPEATTQPTTGVDPTTRPTTVPGQSQSGTQNPGATTGNAGPGTKADRTWILGILRVLGYLGGAVLLIWGQYLLRVRRKRKQMYTGNRNRRALACWREVRRYKRVLKLPVPQELEQLAEKAVFSQHTLTGEELLVLEAWLKDARENLGHRKDGLLLRLIWALA
jgi:hypothetical protein